MTYNNINFNNKTILITGGAGFIGSNLAFYFQKITLIHRLLCLIVLEVKLHLQMATYKALVITKISLDLPVMWFVAILIIKPT